MKDAVATMGAILPDDAGGRDAVHVAVISAVAGQTLRPGDHVGLRRSRLEFLPPKFASANEQEAFAGGAPLGIVDPFIDTHIKKGDRFWLYLYPRTITSLRHQWTHPAFADDAGTVYGTPGQRLEAEQWIKSFADRSGVEYHALMSKAADVADGNSDDYMCFYGSDAHGEIPDEFWIMAEIVLGRPIKGIKPAYFSCSC